MKRLALILALALSACASRPREVRVPVSVPCAPAKLPTEPALVGPTLTGNAERDIGIVAASALRLRQWGRELSALLAACQAPPQ